MESIAVRALIAICVTGLVIIASLGSYAIINLRRDIADILKDLHNHRHNPTLPGIPSSQWGKPIFPNSSSERVSITPPVDVFRETQHEIYRSGEDEISVSPPSVSLLETTLPSFDDKIS